MGGGCGGNIELKDAVALSDFSIHGYLRPMAAVQYTWGCYIPSMFEFLIGLRTSVYGPPTVSLVKAQ